MPRNLGRAGLSVLRSVDMPEHDLVPRAPRVAATFVLTIASLVVGASAFVWLAGREPSERAREPRDVDSVDVGGPQYMTFRPLSDEHVVPQLARNFDPDMNTRQAGILGVVQQESGHFLASPYGSAFAIGNEDGWGGLTGEAIGESYGIGGLGLVGTGRGGGGSGEAGAPAQAVASTWKRSTAQVNASQIAIGDHETLPLRAMQMRAQIDGFRARVLIDLWFDNPHAQQYEGTFKVRLPDGATPLFFAFGQSTWTADKGGTPFDSAEERRTGGFAPVAIESERKAKWVDPKVAKLVPKEQAAHAYGETVHRNVDPALLEWAGAGVFNARVFPILPQRLHRVVMAYETDLVAIGDELELKLPIPPGIATTAVDLNIAVPDPIVARVSPEGAQHVDDDRVEHRLEGVTGETLVVRLAGARSSLLVGDDPDTGSFFAASVAPELSAAPGQLPARAASEISRRAVFVVDTSLSTNQGGFAVWRSLLAELLDRNRGELEEFAVLFFDTDAHWWRGEFVPNTPELRDALLHDVDALVLEGATDLGAALSEAARPAWYGNSEPAYDLFVLSDGGVTWGESDRHAIAARLADGRANALFAYRTGQAGGDAALLDHLARERGGAVFSLNGESELAAAAVAHTHRPWEIERVALAGASDVLIAGRPRSVFPGQRLIVTGRGTPEAGAPIVLTLRDGAGTRAVRLFPQARIASDLAPRAYGQTAVAQLEEVVEATRPVATAYARHFRVVGQTTSLLMLDSEEDYQRFGIVPTADATVVVAHPAGTTVDDALAAFVTTLGDPRAAVLDRLRGLASVPGMSYAPPESLLAALSHASRDAFTLPEPTASAKLQTKRGVPKAVLRALEGGAPDYDAITDEAARRAQRYGAADALVALSSLVEANPGDGVLARDVGFSAMQWGAPVQAYGLFSRVASTRPWEPQSWRAMALAAADADRPELAVAWFEVALDGGWDPRFGDFAQVLALDYLRFLEGPLMEGMDVELAAYARTRLPELRTSVGIDEAELVVIITWNTDASDVDLHVTDPSGEECFYAHPTTRSGGRLTRDVTTGYGPEMFVLGEAPRGTYRIRAKYFAADRNRASARTKVHATILRDVGRPGETREEKVITLATGKEMHAIDVLELD
jgi:Mg-chelatase subunit ChlD